MLFNLQKTDGGQETGTTYDYRGIKLICTSAGSPPTCNPSLDSSQSFIGYISDNIFIINAIFKDLFTFYRYLLVKDNKSIFLIVCLFCGGCSSLLTPVVVLVMLSLSLSL